jgi:hypothetical protein
VASSAAKPGPSPAQDFDTVFEHEKAEIGEFRERVGRPNMPNYTGLALSGGGIRSATFALGAIQALAGGKLIRELDYISSVSGGGYLASWLAGWISRSRTEGGVMAVEGALSQPGDKRPEPQEVYFLRRYSNYLTPEVGALSGDTWALAGIYLRNLLLNLLILILSLSTILLLPRVVVGVARFGRLHQPGGPGALTMLVSSVLVLFAMTRVGFSLRALDANAGWARAKPSASSRPGALYLQVIAPLFIAAASLTAYLKEHFSRRTPCLWWVYAGVSVQVVCWFIGWVASEGNFTKQGLLNGKEMLREVLSESYGQAICSTLVVVVSSAVSGAAAGFGVYEAGCVLREFDGTPGGYWHAMTLGPPLVIAVFLLAGIVQIGLAGVALSDFKREWMGRMGGVLMLYSLIWLLLFGVAIYVPLGIELLLGWAHDRAVHVGAVGVLSWAATTLWGVINGSKGTSFKKNPKPESGIDTQHPKSKLDDPPPSSLGDRAREMALKIAPYVFAIGLFALLSLGVDAVAPKLQMFTRGALAAVRDLHARPEPLATGALLTMRRYFDVLEGIEWRVLLGWLFGGAVLAALLAWRVDINEFSMHHLYRNRLIRCYLGASQGERRAPDLFTGLDPMDDVDLASLAPRQGHIGPYHLFNTSLNLVHGEELAWQKRRASAFVLTPRVCGYNRLPITAQPPNSKLEGSAYVPTAEYANEAESFKLGTAMAISGAAASPNMGYYTTAALAFLLTVFNVRLGWWLPNPRMPSVRRHSGPLFGLTYLFFELFGLTNDRRGYVYLSDGGHFENLGVYELVRRKCSTIVVCDGSADGSLAYDDLANAIERCRVDHGAKITFEPSNHSLGGLSGEGANKPYLFEGAIDYQDGSVGKLFYLKPNLSGVPELGADVRWYAEHVDHRFPHQSTADQWFDEAQFESYRELGYRIMKQAIPRIQKALHAG